MQSGERSVGEVGCIELFWVSTEAGKEGSREGKAVDSGDRIYLRCTAWAMNEASWLEETETHASKTVGSNMHSHKHRRFMY